MSPQNKFPGPGTAMAFAAAVAAGAAAYSYHEPIISKCLLVLAVIFAFFTLIIEYWLTYSGRKIENKGKKLELIKKLHELSNEGIITEEEFSRRKKEILLSL